MKTKRSIATMLKATIILMLMAISFCQCTSKPISKSHDNIVKVNVTYKLPSLLKPDSLILAIDSSNIYYYNQFVIYELPLRVGDFVNDVMIADTMTFFYIGYDTTRSSAYKANSLSDELHEVRLDSFLNKRPVASNLQNLLNASTYCKTDTTLYLGFTKHYAYNSKGADSILLFFNPNLAHVPFSFSRILDSLNHSKLSKIEIQLKEDVSIHAKQFNQFRKISWEMSSVNNISNRSSIIAFCERIQKKDK